MNAILPCSLYVSEKEGGREGKKGGERVRGVVIFLKYIKSINYNTAGKHKIKSSPHVPWGVSHGVY